MKHVRLMKAEQLSVQQRQCRLEPTGRPCANSRAVRSCVIDALYGWLLHV